MINVSNIERFATHDGPGIRTTVFLKGCPLHCPWCANPETWTAEPVLMHKQEKCTGCRKCESVCPCGAVSWENGFHVNRSRCIACGTCVRHCLASALSINGEAMEEEEIIRIVLRDREYYEETDGGVTFSGGEPLFQQEAVLKLLQTAKQHGLHTAVETTGCYPREHLQKAEKCIDLFLFDIKHTDREKLKSVTGGDPDLIFGSFEYLTEKRPQDVIARMPVIPGFNEDALEEMIAYAQAHHVKEINLLPYHNLGKTKWHQLQRNYQFENSQALRKESLNRYVKGNITIGG